MLKKFIKFIKLLPLGALPEKPKEVIGQVGAHHYICRQSRI